MKRQPIDWKTILANHISDKELNMNYLKIKERKKEKSSYNTIAESKQPYFKNSRVSDVFPRKTYKQVKGT